jgi:hypothetical protein
MGAVALAIRRPRGTRTVLALWLAAGLVLVTALVAVAGVVRERPRD